MTQTGNFTSKTASVQPNSCKGYLISSTQLFLQTLTDMIRTFFSFSLLVFVLLSSCKKEEDDGIIYQKPYEFDGCSPVSYHTMEGIITDTTNGNSMNGYRIHNLNACFTSRVDLDSTGFYRVRGGICLGDTTSCQLKDPVLQLMDPNHNWVATWHLSKDTLIPGDTIQYDLQF